MPSEKIPGSEIMDWDRALDLARMCQMSYWDQSQIVPALTADGYLDVIISVVGNLRYFVVKGEKEIIVAFRGTANLGNWMTNINALDAAGSDFGDVHPGFFRAASRLADNWPKKVLELDPHGRREVWLTGHSLGGALAYLAGASFADRERIRGIATFGMPRTGRLDFFDRFEKVFSGRVFRFVNHGDPVPHLPPARLGYAHAGVRIVFGRQEIAVDLARSIGGGEFSDEQIDEIEAAFADLKTRGGEEDELTIQDEIEDERVRGCLPGIRQHRMGDYVGNILEAILAGEAFPGWEELDFATEEPDHLSEIEEVVDGAGTTTSVRNQMAFSELPPFSVQVVWSRASNRQPICSSTAREIFECLSHSSSLEPGLEAGAGIPVHVGHHHRKVQERMERMETGDPGFKMAVVLLLDEHSESDNDFLEFLRWIFREKTEAEKRFWPHAVVVPVWLSSRVSAIEAIPGNLTAVDASSDKGGIPKKTKDASWGVAVEVAHYLLDVTSDQTERKNRTDESPEVSIFLSYSRKDSETNQDLAGFLSRNAKSRIKTFFDVQDFQRGDRIDEQIEKLQEKAVTLAVRTDSYAASPYCQDEILNAKQAGMPVVTLLVLKGNDGAKSRSFPYEANTITLHGLLDRDEIVELCNWTCLRAWLHHLHFHLTARIVFSRRGVGLPPQYLSRPPELLDFVDGPLVRDGTSLVLYSDPPLGNREADLIRRAYPRVRLATPTTFCRETMQRNPAPPLDGMRVAFSLSNSPELSNDFSTLQDDKSGLTEAHLNGLAEYLTLALIRSGAELGYGGHFGSKSYTNLLAGLVAAYKRVRKSNQRLLFSYKANHVDLPRTFDVDLHADTPVEKLEPDGLNLISFSRFNGEIHLRVFNSAGKKTTDKDLADFATESPGTVKVLGDVLEPLWEKGFMSWSESVQIVELTSELLEEEMKPKGHAEVEARIIEVDGATDDPKPGVVDQGLNFSLMRWRMANEGKDGDTRVWERSCDARVVVGGKTRPKLGETDEVGYWGRFPGQAEESWQHLKAGKPIYVVGGFFGSTRQVAQAICGEWDSLPRDESWEDSQYYRDYIGEFDKVSGDTVPDIPENLESLWRDLANSGEGYFWGDGACEDRMWLNGLTVAENRRLFTSNQYDEISALVVKGLCEYRQQLRLQTSEFPLTVALFHGSIVDVLDVEAYAILILGSARLRGADAALDAKLNGEIRKRLDSREKIFDRIIPVNSDRLAGDYVIPHWIEDLGEMSNEPAAAGQWLEENIREGLKRIAEKSARNQVRSLAIVPMGVNLGLTVEESLQLIVEVFRDTSLSGSLRTIALCEVNSDRYHKIKTHLTEMSEEDQMLSVVELPGQPMSAAIPPMFLQFQGERILGNEMASNQVTQIARGPGGTASVPVAVKKVVWAELADEFAMWGNRPPPFEEHEELGKSLVEWFFEPNLFLPAVESEGLSRPWDIMHDRICSAFPFELLRVGDQFPALSRGIRRRLLVENQPYHAPPVHRAIYRVLIVANPTGDLDGAGEEALEIKKVLEREFGEHSIPRMEVTVIEGKDATRPAVLGEVSKGIYDFVHYAGHGDFVPGVPEASGLCLGDGILTSRQLQHALSNFSAPGGEKAHTPTLILLNACLSSRLFTMRERDEFGVSLAQAVLQTGVGGFLGNRWLVGDRAARDFAIEVFTDLAVGVTLGDAILAGRRKLHARRSRDWCNYVFYGSPEIRL